MACWVGLSPNSAPALIEYKKSGVANKSAVSLRNFRKKKPMVDLTSGNDTYTGTNNISNIEIINALAGDDIVHGAGGTDYIYGDEGNDALYGDAGDDLMYGDDGIDLVNGGLGNDNVNGGYGNDTVYGGDGHDTIDGGYDTDKVYRGIGNDLVDGGWGDDFVYGDAGNDTVWGSDGDDYLDGGAGADSMAGGRDNDTYLFGAGDKVKEGSGNGTGIDTVQSFYGFSLSNTTQFEGDIEYAQLRGAANVNVAGNVLNNTLTGNGGANTVYGGAGNDVINGFTGNDTLYGQAGSDRFLFNTTPNAGSNLDKIADFNVPQDAIWLDNAIFKALGNPALLSAAAFHVGTAAHDLSDRIIYNSVTGALSYDSNGSAAGGSVQFATLSTGLAMTNADFLIV